MTTEAMAEREPRERPSVNSIGSLKSAEHVRFSVSNENVMRDARAEARVVARRVLQQFGVETGHHLEIERWVQSFGITLVEAPLDGAKAQLVRVGSSAHIVLPEANANPAQRRFSMAHELYHYLRRHPSPSPARLCTPRALAACDQASHVYEVGANAFAGEVLLPEFLVRRRCEVSPVDLEVTQQLSDEFTTSILTAAIRFTELSSERCAAVFSARNADGRGEIVWFAPSATFRVPRRMRGRPLKRQSVAWDFFAHGALDARAQPVDAAAWLDTSETVAITEHSIVSQTHQTVLSLLWVPDRVGPQLGMP